MAEEMKTVLNDYRTCDQYITKEVHRRASERGISFRQALDEYAAENPSLFKLKVILRRREQARQIDLKTYEIKEGRLVQIEQDIRGLIEEVRKKHPELDFGDAMQATFSEHPEIWREREALRRELYG